jgi:hypothetical protein
MSALIRIPDKAKARDDPRRLNRVHRPAFHSLNPDLL